MQVQEVLDISLWSLDRGKYEIETQEELAEYLNKEGYNVTQATVSRDIRELKLSKIQTENGGQKYAARIE